MMKSAREQKRRRKMQPVAIACFLVMVAGGSLLLAWRLTPPAGDTGSYLIAQGSMSDEEARAMLDEQVESSRITVSLRPVQELVDGMLHVNFVVVPGNNDYSERLVIDQDGQVVYASGVVDPEHYIEWGSAPQAHVGAATATVYAVDSQGGDFGNPVSVEVEIVEGA